MKSIRNPTTAVCFAVCVITIISTTLIASHAQNSGTIYGCMKRPNGQLRVVSGPGLCNPSESEISWSSGGGAASGEHHQDLRFTLAPNEIRRIVLPQTSAPLTINASTSAIHYFDGNTGAPLLNSIIYSYDAAAGLGQTVTVAFTGNSIQNADYTNLNLHVTPDNLLEVEYAVPYNEAGPTQVAISLWY